MWFWLFVFLNLASAPLQFCFDNTYTGLANVAVAAYLVYWRLDERTISEG